MCFDYRINWCYADNSEAYEQQKYSEPQIQSNATSHSGTAFPNMNYAMPAQLSAENAVVLFDSLFLL